MPFTPPTAHGGRLVDLLATPERAEQLRSASIKLPQLALNDRQLCDLEMMMNGGFSPLSGFMVRSDYESVLENMRLADGTLWPIAVTLDVSEEVAQGLEEGGQLILRDKEGFALATLTISDIWRPDRSLEAEQLFGSTDPRHPGANYLLEQSAPVYLGGTLEGILAPKHYDYLPLRHTPAQVRKRFAELGWERVVAFQTRNPMHRAHVELTLRAAHEAGANILIHPVVGLTSPGDVNHYTRVRCYEYVLSRYDPGTAMLSLLPLAMRMGGPREALWHAIIRKNYGCSHFIVGRDHAGPGKDGHGRPFYGPYDAQELVKSHQDELGVTMVPFKNMVYVASLSEYQPEDEVQAGAETEQISGTELRRRLDEGLELPAWFSYPDVVAELRRAQPKLSRRGLTIFFTGLSGAGKSTLARGVLVKLLEDGRRPVTLLDGDIVRTHLSSELGFSQEHRSLNVRRIGFVASEITKNRGIAICAPIAPYAADRQFNRELISGLGGYIEVYVSTPLEVCEQRDVKGLYAKARQGLIKHVTGVDDPYEPPTAAEIVVDSSFEAPEAIVERIVDQIRKSGYL